MILGLKQMTVNSAKNRDVSRMLGVIMLMKSLVNTVGPHQRAKLCHSLTKLTKTGTKHKVRLSYHFSKTCYCISLFLDCSTTFLCYLFRSNTL